MLVLFLLFVLILYIILDMNYFVRCFCVNVVGWVFQSKYKVTDTTTVYGLSTSQDVDIFLMHMNNARFLCELDFARIHFSVVTGICAKSMRCGACPFLGAVSVRYRRTIPIFHRYKMETKLIWWDDKTLYFEQQFVTLAGGFVRAVVMSKQCIANCNVLDVMETFPEASKRPEMPVDLKMWLDAIEESSQKLRKDEYINV